MISRTTGGEPTAAPDLEAAELGDGRAVHTNGHGVLSSPGRERLDTILPVARRSPRVIDSGEAAEDDADDRHQASRLLRRAVWHSGPWLPVLIITALVLVVASIALPAVVGRAVDSLFGQAPKSWLTWTAIVV